MTVTQRPAPRRYDPPTWLRGDRGRVLAAAVLGLSLLAIATGLVLFDDRAPVDYAEVVEIQVAGRPGEVESLVCDPNVGTAAAGCIQLSDLRTTLSAERWLLLGYAGIAGICLVGAGTFASRRARRAAFFAGLGVVVAGVLDLVENVLTGVGLDAIERSRLEAVWPWVSANVGMRLVLLVMGIAVATAALVVVGTRALLRPTDYRWLVGAEGTSGGPEVNVHPPPAVCDDQGGRVPASGRPVRSYDELGRPPGDVGLCLSGGGIRSATTALGLLQVLQETDLLGRARYLVSVSGGGYVAGALRLAVQPRKTIGPIELDHTEPPPFAAGTPELDHLRRHGRYLADSLTEWLVAAAVLLRGVLVSLFLLAGAVTTLGLVLGACYRIAPVADLEALLRGDSLDKAVTAGGVLATGTLLAVAVAFWLLNVTTQQWRSRSVPWLLRLAWAVTCLALASLLLTIGLPALLWAAEWTRDTVATPGAVGTGLSAVAVSYVGAAVTMLWRHRTVAGRLRALFTSEVEGTPSRLPSGIIPRLIVVAALALMAVLFAALLAEVLAATVRPDPFRLYPADLYQWLALGAAGLAAALLLMSGIGASPSYHRLRVRTRVGLGALGGAIATLLLIESLIRGEGAVELVDRWTRAGASLWPHVWLLVTPALFLLAAWLLDQTWSSLHPFYRRRLATAFAVRRVRLDDGQLAAEPYEFDRERTRLSSHGTWVDGLPQVIFAAAANLSGPDRTPPGRRATSFTFSHDWVGGPEVGFVATKPLEDNTKGAVDSDLSVQSAVAISGAAFASAMGRQARAVQTLLAISNARLGTWLPNPAWLAARTQRHDWLAPRLPSVRRITTLLREVVGSHPPTDRLLLVTDGGHYENLGLVELLRHRCRTVLCLDASGDPPPATQMLAEAITLARDELGVTLRLTEPFTLTPGRGPTLAPEDPLAGLSSRLSGACAVVGTVEYPEPFQLDGESAPSRTGTIVVAKLRLTADMPYELLAYAQQHPEFPYDSTGDQWFEQNQFDAYLGLGRHLGEHAVAKIRPPGTSASPARGSSRR